MRDAPRNKAGVREPTPDRRWFQQWLGYAFVYAIAFFLIEWLLGSLCSRYSADLITPILQGLLVPVAIIAYSYRQERRALKHAPRRSSEGGPVEIRDVSGRLLHTSPQVDLRAAQFSGLRLKGACLWGEHLEGADFHNTDLTQAWLRAAVLRDADLRGARLHRADLIDADLRNADLRGTDLSQVGLAHTELSGAVFNDSTRWPDGFRPERRGCIRADGVQPNLPLPARAVQHGTESLPRPAAVRDDAPLEQHNSRG